MRRKHKPDIPIQPSLDRQPVHALPGAAIFLVIVLGLFGAGAPALAQEADAPQRLRDQAEFSAVNTSGNSDVLTLAVKNSLEYDFSPDLMGTWHLDALYGEQDNVKNAERYSTDVRLDYELSTANYLYLLGGWLRDRFAGFDNRYHAGPGMGRKVFIGPRHFLKAEVGANWAREEYVDEDAQDFLEGRAYGQYDFVISQGNRFLQSIEYLHDFEDSDNYKIKTVTAVTSALTKVLAIKIGYEVRYQNRPIPATLEKTDTVLSASLVVSY